MQEHTNNTDAKKKKRYLIIITALMLLALITFVLIASDIIKIKSNVPETSIDINKDNSEDNANSDDINNEGDTDSNANSNGIDENGTEGTGNSDNKSDTANDSVGDSDTFIAKPGMDVTDSEGSWTQNTAVTIFKASYDNESGDMTVNSESGVKVIAPGTSNRYNFYVNNTGNVPIEYVMTAKAIINATADGKSYNIPLEARFYNQNGQYLLGTENNWSEMKDMKNIEDQKELSVDHYNKYTLEWQWPFEGDDEFDTLLGNLAAEGNELEVIVNINVVATADTDAAGGLPKTGDTKNIAVWTGLCVCSAFLFVLLLFGRRKDEDEEY